MVITMGFLAGGLAIIAFLTLSQTNKTCHCTSNTCKCVTHLPSGTGEAKFRVFFMFLNLEFKGKDSGDVL